MSIESAIINAQEKVVNSYTACREMGATLPNLQNLENLPETIRSIPTGHTYPGLNVEYYTKTGHYTSMVVNGGLLPDYSSVGRKTYTLAPKTDVQGYLTYVKGYSNFDGKGLAASAGDYLRPTSYLKINYITGEL